MAVIPLLPEQELLGQCLDISGDRIAPFHVPSTRLVMKSQPKIRAIVYNFRDLTLKGRLDEDCPNEEVKCCCASVLARHPDLTVVDGHIASTASKLKLSPRLTELAASSSNNSAFVDAESHQSHSLVAIQQLTSKHNLLCLPEDEILEEWRGIWGTHQCYIQDRRTVEDVRHLFDAAKSLVWHVRDHEGSQLHVFCPVKYWTMLSNTFGAEQVFRNPFLTCSQAHVQVEQRVPPSILDDFSFGFRFRMSACNLPYAYILPKHKKNWKGGIHEDTMTQLPCGMFCTGSLTKIAQMKNGSISIRCIIRILQAFSSVSRHPVSTVLALLLIRLYALDPDDDLTSQLEGTSMTVSISRDLSAMRTFQRQISRRLEIKTLCGSDAPADGRHQLVVQVLVVSGGESSC